MNKFRVDVNNQKRVPCGMNSIHYIGDNEKQAHRIFEETMVGVDSWGKSNIMYGVIFSVWNESKGEYVIKRVKGFDIQ